MLAAAALAFMPAACGLGAGNDISPPAIRAAFDQGDFGRVQSMVAAAFAAGEVSGEIRLLAGLNDLSIDDGIGAENNLRIAQNMGIAADVTGPLIAEALARQGKNDAAKALAAAGNHPAAAAIVEGIAARMTDQPWQAREAFERAYQLSPQNQRLALDLAEMRAQLGLFGEALRLTKSVAAARPRNIRARIITGDIHRRLRDFSAAKTAYDSALKIRPENAAALTGKAHAIYGQNEWAAAEKLLSGLPDDLTNREDIQRLRGKMAARQGQHAKARSLFAGAGDSLFGDDEAMYLAAQGFTREGQHWKAVRLLESAVRARPDLPEYRAGLIGAYRAAGDDAAAAKARAAIPPGLLSAPALQGL